MAAADPNDEGNLQEKLKRITEKIVGLPTLPSMLQNINRLMLNPRTSAKEVAQLISSDPAIASKVLRVVNSSFYGFPNRIASISHAIVILGFNTVKSIVLSSTIFDVFKGDKSNQLFDRNNFWRHSVGCGASARAVGRVIGSKALEEIFIAGLLSDIGKIVLDQFLHEHFVKILERTRSTNCLLAKAEQDHLGITHAEVGAWLFEKWNMSKGLIEAIRYHHNPAMAGENKELAAIVHLADILVRSIRFGSGGDNKIPAISDTAWQSLRLNPDQFDRLLTDTGEEIEKAMVFLDFIH
jgi:HD-like signal output (HDOD) protein